MCKKVLIGLREVGMGNHRNIKEVINLKREDGGTEKALELEF
jgi:hypothetical protein